MQEIFNYSIFGNSVYNYLIALGIFIGGTLIVFIFKKYILSRLKRWAESTSTSLDDLLVRAIEKSLIPVFYFGIFYMSLHTLILSPDFKKGLSIAAIILITILIVRTIISAINHGLRTYLRKSDDSYK